MLSIPKHADLGMLQVLVNSMVCGRSSIEFGKLLKELGKNNLFLYGCLLRMFGGGVAVVAVAETDTDTRDLISV
jgi:hypothetical protein